MNGINKLGDFTQTSTMINHSIQQAQNNRFESLLKSARNENQSNENSSTYLNSSNLSNLSNISSNQIAKNESRLNGEIGSTFEKLHFSESDKNARASGFAANSKNAHDATGSARTIDKTSKLYEKSLELESFFVKMMVDSMRKTVSKSSGENGFAQKMYEDMLYDEYTTALTKNAGFGIADSIYLELNR